jgi:hypothetical protein
VRLFWSALPAYDLLIWVFARRVAAMPGLPQDARRFWRRAGQAAVLFVVGDLSQTAVAWLHPGPAAAVPNPFQAAARATSAGSRRSCAFMGSAPG